MDSWNSIQSLHLSEILENFIYSDIMTSCCWIFFLCIFSMWDLGWETCFIRLKLHLDVCSLAISFKIFLKVFCLPNNFDVWKKLFIAERYSYNEIVTQPWQTDGISPHFKKIIISVNIMRPPNFHFDSS